ncbi:MAG: hypothetical protein KF760_05570 [Candidatus Eremiobacteraeota bacterium]|nr:hypothetical protein [Candidatus Eremiobacteraeota bacterium]MCW5870050.1 hypothetical protein [Candidatus Eremiobacteraeota bacterium]
MSKRLGQFGVTLHERDLNGLLAAHEAAFKGGCFQLRTKLPMGLGVTLVAVPRSTPDSLVFSIPFDQIRGDKTGGMAAMLAGGLWGVIRPVIEKRLKKELNSRHIPEETVSLGQAAEGKVKVGLVTLHLKPLNAWLLRQPAVAGLKIQLDAVWATEDQLQLVLGVLQDR